MVYFWYALVQYGILFLKDAKLYCLKLKFLLELLWKFKVVAMYNKAYMQYEIMLQLQGERWVGR